MASLMQGLGQAVISRLPLPPDPLAGEGGGIAGLASGFVSGQGIGGKRIGAAKDAAKESGQDFDAGFFERLGIAFGFGGG